MDSALLNLRRQDRQIRQKNMRGKNIADRRGIADKLKNLSLEDESMTLEKIITKDLDERQLKDSYKMKQVALRDKLTSWRKEKEKKKCVERQQIKGMFVVKHVVTPPAPYLTSKDLKNEPAPTKSRNPPRACKQAAAEKISSQQSRSHLTKTHKTKNSNCSEINKAAPHQAEGIPDPIPSYKEWKKGQRVASSQTKAAPTRPVKKCADRPAVTKIDAGKAKSSRGTCRATSASDDAAPAKHKPEAALVSGSCDFIFNEKLAHVDFNFLPDVTRASPSEKSIFSVPFNHMDSLISKFACPFANSTAYECTEAGSSAGKQKQDRDLNDVGTSSDAHCCFPTSKSLGESAIDLQSSAICDKEETSKRSEVSANPCQANQEAGAAGVNLAHTPSAVLRNKHKVLVSSQLALSTPKACLAFIPNELTPKTPLPSIKNAGACVAACGSAKSAIFSAKHGLTPKNFLSKLEDPVTCRIATPLRLFGLPDDAKQQGTPREVAESVCHFSNLVNRESEKFQSFIDTWNSILEQSLAPDHVHGDILSAIGQAQLLMRKRFQQFRELIELHKDRTAEKAAHASDLAGFWEMISFQVDDVHKRFAELDIMKDNNWVERVAAQPSAVRKAKKPVLKKADPKKMSREQPKRENFRKFMQEKLKERQLSDIESLKDALAPSSTRDTIDTLSVAGSNAAATDENVFPDPPATSLKADLRRSTRKTPSKYRRPVVDPAGQDIVARDLFATPLKDRTNITSNRNEKDSDFTQYLTKQSVLDTPCVQESVLDGILSPTHSRESKTENEEASEVSDLMMFSPMPGCQLVRR